MHITLTAYPLPCNAADFCLLWNSNWSVWLSWLSSHSSLFIIQGFNRNHKLEKWTVTILVIDSSNTQGRGNPVTGLWRQWGEVGRAWALRSDRNLNPGSAPYSWVGQLDCNLVDPHYSCIRVLANSPVKTVTPEINTYSAFTVILSHAQRGEILNRSPAPHRIVPAEVEQGNVLSTFCCSSHTVSMCAFCLLSITFLLFVFFVGDFAL